MGEMSILHSSDAPQPPSFIGDSPAAVTASTLQPPPISHSAALNGRKNPRFCLRHEREFNPCLSRVKRRSARRNSCCEYTQHCDAAAGLDDASAPSSALVELPAVVSSPPPALAATTGELTTKLFNISRRSSPPSRNCSRLVHRNGSRSFSYVSNSVEFSRFSSHPRDRGGPEGQHG